MKKTPAYLDLQQHLHEIKPIHMRSLFEKNHNRAQDFTLNVADLLIDFSKNLITEKTLYKLCRFAEQQDLRRVRDALFRGEPINNTEQRSVLHTALRDLTATSIYANDRNIVPDIQDALQRMQQFSEQIREQRWLGFNQHPIREIVNIGIGGSDLGPKMVVEALSAYQHPQLRFHFVSNVDGTALSQTLRQCNPAETLFIISSKSFMTLETLTNAQTAKEWIYEYFGTANAMSAHFIAITSHSNRARRFGVSEQHIFPIWDWVGGRYSLWSTIGFPIVMSIGMERFMELLAGAHTMDLHFANTDLLNNIPVILALIGFWYIEFFEARSQAIIPYNQYLQYLCNYLQQIDMESNGKRVNRDGKPVDYCTGTVVWGAPGSNGQHAFHQLLLQGTQLIPVDFIIPVNSHNPLKNHHENLFAACLSQSRALMLGKTEEQAYQECLTAGIKPDQALYLARHQTIPGNRPSNTICFPKLTPRHLGALLALYEHKIFVQGRLWQINSFDQWGVELGKQMAQEMIPFLNNQNPLSFDASSDQLINYYRQQTQAHTIPLKELLPEEDD